MLIVIQKYIKNEWKDKIPFNFNSNFNFLEKFIKKKKIKFFFKIKIWVKLKGILSFHSFVY